MKTLRSLAIVIVGGLTAAFSAGCSAASDDADSSADALSAPGQNDLPWEVRTREGELVLPNVFYAEASETDQLIPPTVHGRYQIDRLVYPTIGNPNLYVKPDAKDAVLLVLRIEPQLLAHLGAHWDGVVAGSPLNAVSFDNQGDADGLRFFLVPRSHRDQAEGDGAADPQRGIYEVKPSALLAHPIALGMPEAFKARRTLRAEFDQGAMQDVPAGLYDVRFEVRKAGKIVASEFQYNAVRVFDHAASTYSIVNVTDTQVTAGTHMEQLTLPHLREFVDRVNLTTDPEVRNAAFITFNGDLHNGGSAEVLLPHSVANTYRTEAAAILDTLKNLTVPIFLTVGNHDGYVSTGHPLPGIDGFASITPFVMNLKQTVREARPELSDAQFDQLWARFSEYRTATETTPGGRKVDVFNGKVVRRAPGASARHDATKAFETWTPVDAKRANWILYDGQNQWQRTYGPLATSWDFGKTKFVNMNTYELRQHRRSGWGMYTVNYGGGISRVQNAWIEEEVKRAESADQEVVLIGHHDPRGGHNGKDYPYQFGMIDYQPGVATYNYVLGEIYNKYACTASLDWVRTALAEIGIDARLNSCLHDGLQEWMRPDDFDCADDTPRDGEGKCVIDPNAPPSATNRYWSSGFALIHKLATHPNVRTLLLGHTHYNSLEVLQSNDEIVPGSIALDTKQEQQLEALEAATPLRSRGSSVPPKAIVSDGLKQIEDLAAAGNDFKRNVMGDKRELVILRTTSNANLTSQKFNDKPMFGYVTLKITQRSDARAYARPQINEVTFYINDAGQFDRVQHVAIDRTQHIGANDERNPLSSLFKM